MEIDEGRRREEKKVEAQLWRKTGGEGIPKYLKKKLGNEWNRQVTRKIKKHAQGGCEQVDRKKVKQELKHT